MMQDYPDDIRVKVSWYMEKTFVNGTMYPHPAQ
jgi:hypothetical protein